MEIMCAEFHNNTICGMGDIYSEIVLPLELKTPGGKCKIEHFSLRISVGSFFAINTSLIE